MTTLGTSLPYGCHLSIASPPSRFTSIGLTVFGWFYVPAWVGFHTTTVLDYGSAGVEEGFQFDRTAETTAQGFAMCYSPNFHDIGGVYANGTWYFQADVYSLEGATYTRKTYISGTPGGNPTLIDTTTWGVSGNPSPEFFHIGDAPGYSRSLQGSFQYCGLAATAMSPAELAAQSASRTPTVACWAFVAGENGDYTDQSGNARTVTVTYGPPVASDVGVTLPDPSVTASVSAVAGAPTASAVLSIGEPITVTVAATAGAPQASVSGFVGEPITVSCAAVAGAPSASAIMTIGTMVNCNVAASAGAPVASATLSVGQAISFSVAATAGAPSASASLTVTGGMMPRVLCYGNSVTAGYGVSDADLHYPAQLAGLLGARVESVVELGYSGETTASLLGNFDDRILPHIEAGRPTIIVFQEIFNSANYGVSVADTMAAFWAVCQKCHDVGAQVIVQDCSKAGSAQAHEETAVACNALVASDWPSHADGMFGLRGWFFDPTDTTMYQSDRAHFTPLGLHKLAQLAYAEVNRLLLGSSFVGAVTVGAFAGSPTASASLMLSNSPVTVHAIAGAPTASATMVIGEPISCAIAASAGAPTALARLTVGDVISFAASAMAGAPIAAASCFIRVPVVSVSALAGAPIASVIFAIGESIAFAVSATAGAPTASARCVSGVLHANALMRIRVISQTPIPYGSRPQIQLDVEHPTRLVMFGTERNERLERVYEFGVSLEIERIVSTFYANGESYLLTVPPIVDGLWEFSARTEFGIVNGQRHEVELPSNSLLIRNPPP